MNDSPSRSVDTPPNVEPNAPDSGEKHQSPEHEGEHVTPQQHPLVELPPRTEPEVPAKPQRDVPFADPPRAGSGGVEMANEDSSLKDTIPVAPIPAATEPLREAWQAPPPEPLDDAEPPRDAAPDPHHAAAVPLDTPLRNGGGFGERQSEGSSRGRPSAMLRAGRSLDRTGGQAICDGPAGAGEGVSGARWSASSRRGGRPCTGPLWGSSRAAPSGR